MEIAFFGPDVYSPNEETASQLSSDIKLLPELMKSWSPTIATGLFHAHSPVGAYDKHMKSIVYEESLAWSRKLKQFPKVSLAVGAPARKALVPRGTYLLKAMTELFPVPDTPFWHAVAEQVYGYAWCLVDMHKLCRRCVHGVCCAALMSCFPDYYHFRGNVIEVLDICAQHLVEYIDHVHHDHLTGAPEYKVMDAWLMCIQSAYLDILHPKASSLQFPDDELRSIRYRLINSAGRALALEARLEQDIIIGDDHIVDAVAFASTVMHDICDFRHDNTANEFYNLLTIVSGHTGMQCMDIIRRFCIDVWAWAIDNGAYWAIHHAGRELAWQIYMARYQTPVLLDNLHAPASAKTNDPYGDQVLNGLNPLPPSAEPHNYSISSRCQNAARYHQLLENCLKHFKDCSGCRDYDTASWQDRVPLIGAAYEKKYTDCSGLNTISSYLILASPDEVWWLADPTAQYTGPTSEWSPLLC
jgi:hypothetical protein